MKKLLQSLFILMLIAGTAIAQDRTITGTVTGKDDGLPLPGVSVVVQGTKNGTQTGANGKYVITVPSGSANLVFSYLGYVTETLSVSGNVLDVVLTSDSQSLSEVVVTALGISKDKKSLGYATQNLNSEELNRGNNTTLAGAIQGKVSGVQVIPSSGMPGASSQIIIRGARSFEENNTPLYVIDGLPINSSADIGTGNSVTDADLANRGIDIDPNDIESVNILKGQAASALYGMRASNGAIIITTKSGKNAKGKPQITFNSTTSFDRISVLPDLQKEYSQGTGGKYNPTASTSWGSLISELPNDATYGGNVSNTNTGNGANLHPGQYYVRQRALAGLDPWATPQVYDNIGDFFNTGATYANSVSVLQGHDKGSYAFSFGNTQSNGIIPSTGLNRYNIKLAAEAKLDPHFTTGFVGSYINSRISKQTSANNGIVATVYGAPLSYDLKGIPSHVAGDPYSQNTYRSTSGFDGAYWGVENNEFNEWNQRFFGNGNIQYNSALGTTNQKLNLKYQIGVDSYTTNYRDMYGYGHANGKGEVKEYSYNVNELNSLFTATYNWTINSDLSLDLLYGNEIVERKRRYNYAFGSAFNYSGFNNINNASSYSTTADLTRRRTFGNFANATLAYANMLYLNITGRQDIISTMPRANRSFFYPSAALSWVFTELEPLKNKVVTFGKLRFSIAEAGQAGEYIDSYYSTPVFGGGFSSGTPILYPIGTVVAYTPDATVYDPNLKPQNTRSYEIGTDLSFFGDVATLSYTYSRQNVKDQIFAVPLAGSTGSSELITNGGSIHTNAHEVTLGFKPFKRDNFKWDIAFNFSKVDNYVDALAEGVESIFLGGFTEPQVRASIGEKFPTIYGVSYLRNDAGQIVVDENGFPQAGPEQVIGRVSPDFLLGLNTAFEIYKFRITGVLDWKKGGQMYSGTTGLMDFYGVSKYSGDVRKAGTSFKFPLDAVKADGSPNDIMIDGSNAQNYFSTINTISESMIYDNSFVKLREVSIGYPVYQKKGLKVNLSAFARNIILWSEIKGIDPEISQGNTNMAGAFERFSMPGTSNYGFGLNVNF